MYVLRLTLPHVRVALDFCRMRVLRLTLPYVRVAPDFCRMRGLKAQYLHSPGQAKRRPGLAWRQQSRPVRAKVFTISMLHDYTFADY